MIRAPKTSRLKELLDYNPRTGIFRWKCDGRGKRQRAGEISGYIDDIGRRKICIDQKTYFAHRLAWQYVHGFAPRRVLNIKNGNPSDTRISNLRLPPSRSHNMANAKLHVDNTSGYKGVYLRANKSGWRSSIGVNYRQIHLGSFKDAKSAHRAYCKAARHYWGEFARSA